MVDEVITIPELQNTLSVDGTEQAVIRQGGLDKRVTLAVMKAYFATAASLSTAGIVQLNNSTNSSSTTEAATPNAVKLAYDRATTALNTANSALSGLAGKANTVHTHAATDIVSGTMNADRLPLGTLGTRGAVQQSNSIANPVGDSANGFVPSLVLVANMQATISGINNTLVTLANNGTYNRWDGGPTNLNPATGRNSLGATPLGTQWFTMPTPTGNRWARITSSGTVVLESSTGTKQSLGIGSATTSTEGLVVIAEDAEVNNGTNGVVPTARQLRLGFEVSLNTNPAYIKFPTWMGGYIRAWGSIFATGGFNSTVTLSGIFPNAITGVSATLPVSAATDQRPARANPSGRNIAIRNPDGTATTIYYTADGY